MSAEDLTPAGLLIGFLIVVALFALLWAAWAWGARRRSGRTEDQDGPVIDLTYLERAIKADEEAASRRRAEHKPLFSKAPGTSADASHRLPTDET